VNSDADSFRKRASQCRDVAKGTKNLEAQRELRDLASDLDTEASKIDAEEAAKASPAQGPLRH
jgi:hypothetical protein